MTIFQEALSSFLFAEGTAPLQKQPRYNQLIVAVSKAIALFKGRSIGAELKVAVLATTIAQKMNLSPREHGALAYSALVRDIGLCKVAADVHQSLQAQDKNSRKKVVKDPLSEKDCFRLHALINAKVISSPYPESSRKRGVVHISAIDQHLAIHPVAAKPWLQRLMLSQEVCDIVAQHHELIDGSGYPMGIVGEQISLGAKILAFADTLEAALAETTGLTSKSETLNNFLTIKAPGKFAPEVIETFNAILSDKPDFLKELAELTLEDWIYQVLPKRQTPMTGPMLLNMASVMGELADSLMPFYTERHSYLTTLYAMNMAQHMAFEPEQLGQLMVASLLHDIGQLTIPMAVLTKSQSLDKDEWSQIHHHPAMAYDILKGIDGFELVSEWCLEHHEQMNGRGYPSQKKGFEISTGGRLLAIADVFAALTSARPYRDAMRPLDALAEMEQGRFSQFDHQLLKVLRQVVMESRIDEHPVEDTPQDTVSGNTPSAKVS